MVPKMPALAVLLCAQMGLGAGPALAQETIRVPTDASFGIRPSDLPDCRDDERLQLTLGGSPIAPPRGSVEMIVPAQLSVSGDINAPQEMWMELPAGAGCEHAPLQASIAFVPAELSGSPLDIILAAQTSGPFAQMARLRDSGQCTRIEGQRVACSGSTQVEGQVVQVTAVIASDASAVASDGLPLFMICEQTEAGLLCEASGVRQGIGFKALTPGPNLPSVDDIRAVYEAVDAAFAAWRR